MFIVNRIVDRCQVGQSNRQVIRYFASFFETGVSGFMALPKDLRRTIMRAAIARHTDNQRLYKIVLGGANAYSS